MLVHHVICRVRVSTLGGRGCSLIHSMFIRQETGWDNTARNCILHYLLSATISSLRHKFNFSPNFSSRASSFTSFINAARNLFLVCTMFCRTVQSLTTPSRATAAERLSRLQPHHGFLSLLVLLTRADPSQNIDIFPLSSAHAALEEGFFSMMDLFRSATAADSSLSFSLLHPLCGMLCVSNWLDRSGSMNYTIQISSSSSPPFVALHYHIISLQFQRAKRWLS